MNLPIISLDRKTLSNFEDVIQKEWIITNGMGGYASSTVLGINTRKYHGLLIAALHPPGDRRLFLAKLDEDVIIGNEIYRLGANEFQCRIFPRGFIFLKEFSVLPFPRSVYSVGDVGIRKTVFMPNQKNVVFVIYEVANRSDHDARIQVFPLASWRRFHSVVDRWKVPADIMQRQNPKEVEMNFQFPQSTLIVGTTDGNYSARQRWVERLYFREEAHRVESCFDDYFNPGYFEVRVKAGKTEKFALTAVAGEDRANTRGIQDELPVSMYDITALYEKEIEGLKHYLRRFYENYRSILTNDWLSWLLLASNTFLVETLNREKSAVIAGYHWFESWGRDTFISLPGLMLVTGRFKEARKVFLTFKRSCKNGLIPNFLSDQTVEPVYNAVDATLWYVNAILQYLKYTNDFSFVKEHIWTSLTSIIEEYKAGTAFDIHVDSDGLLNHDSRLTWMDAAVGKTPVTPRKGKAVEVQALWYNALRTVELLANKFGEAKRSEEFARIAETAKESFTEKFWNTENGCLFDVVSATARDDSLRPNQILAVSLDFLMLNNEKNRSIVDSVHHELVTPYGLRTLTTADHRYVGVYDGDRGSRDNAYHNGTAWPWLIGPFATAFLRIKGYSKARREYVWNALIEPLVTTQLLKAGLGSISEIFDGDPPNKPRGCIAQAWSVAEALRVYVEDLMQARPKYEAEILSRS